MVLQDPECNNGPFYIYRFTDYTHSNSSLYDGFHIEIKDVDLRWMTHGETAAFSAWHVGDNRVMVKMPSESYSFLKDPKAEDTAKTNAKYANARILEANSVVRNDIVNDPERHSKYYLLSFPVDSDPGLANDIFSPDAENGKIQVDLHPIMSSFEIPTSSGQKKVTSFRANVVWDIAIAPLTTRFVKEAKPPKNDLAEKMANVFSSMTI